MNVGGLNLKKYESTNVNEIDFYWTLISKFTFPPNIAIGLFIIWLVPVGILIHKISFLPEDLEYISLIHLPGQTIQYGTE